MHYVQLLKFKVNWVVIHKKNKEKYIFITIHFFV